MVILLFAEAASLPTAVETLVLASIAYVIAHLSFELLTNNDSRNGNRSQGRE